MAAPRTRGPRVVTGVAGVALCAVVAALPLHDLGLARATVAMPGALAVLLAAAGVVRGWETAPPFVAAGLAATYGIAVLVRHGPFERDAPLIAAALLLAVELCAWSIELRSPVGEEAAVLVARGLAVASLAAGALAASALVALTVAAPRANGVGWAALGAAAAVAAVTVIARLAGDPR